MSYSSVKKPAEYLYDLNFQGGNPDWDFSWHL